MRAAQLTIAAAVAGLLTPGVVFGANSTSDDRIALSANGSTLTGTDGGGGGSAGWLHNFDADTLVGVAVEHQALSSAHWTFGSVNGSMTRGPGDARYSVYAEAHEGAGNDGPKHLKYSIETAGVIGTYFHRLSVQLEDREIDVETVHGNLPKLGLSYQWTRRILTSVSYAYSVNGDLGTRLTSARIDEYGQSVNFLAGVAVGQASAAVLNEGFIVAPGRRLREGYAGISKPLRHLRGDLSLIADYQDLSGSKRVTVTLNYIFHVGNVGTAR
ncbi:MAG: hypothetical protein ACREU6_16615 [Steroidobacteraceae bacterium]